DARARSDPRAREPAERERLIVFRLDDDRAVRIDVAVLHLAPLVLQADRGAAARESLCVRELRLDPPLALAVDVAPAVLAVGAAPRRRRDALREQVRRHLLRLDHAPAGGVEVGDARALAHARQGLAHERRVPLPGAD